MTKKTKAPKAPTREERAELLERLWAAHTRKLVEKIENTPADAIDAATFNAAAKMLAENGITADALDKHKSQMGRQLAEEVRQMRREENDEALYQPVPIPPITEETLTQLRRLEDN